MRSESERPEFEHLNLQPEFYSPDFSKLEPVEKSQALLEDELREFWRAQTKPEDLKTLERLFLFKPAAHEADPDKIFLARFETLHLKTNDVHALYLAARSKYKLDNLPAGMLELNGNNGPDARAEHWYSFPPVDLDVLAGVADQIERLPRGRLRAGHLREAIERLRSGTYQT